MLGIEQENYYQLSESPNQLIIYSSIRNHVELTKTYDLGLEPDKHFNRSTKSNDVVRINGISLDFEFWVTFFLFLYPF